MCVYNLRFAVTQPASRCLLLVQKADSVQAMKGLPPFASVPRVGSIVNMSVLTTLYYCVLYHHSLGEVIRPVLECLLSLYSRCNELTFLFAF